MKALLCTFERNLYFWKFEWTILVRMLFTPQCSGLEGKVRFRPGNLNLPKFEPHSSIYLNLRIAVIAVTSSPVSLASETGITLPYYNRTAWQLRPRRLVNSAMTCLSVDYSLDLGRSVYSVAALCIESLYKCEILGRITAFRDRAIKRAIKLVKIWTSRCWKKYYITA